MQDKLKDAGEQLSQRQREVMLKLVENAEENISDGFETLRGMIAAGNISDAIKLQNEAVARSVERNMDQVKELGELMGANQDMYNRLTEMMSSIMPGRNR